MKTSDFDYDLPESLIANYPQIKELQADFLSKLKKSNINLLKILLNILRKATS